MTLFQSTRKLKCYSEEWARNKRISYRPEYRHKRTVLPVSRSFTEFQNQRKGVPWLDLQTKTFFKKYHGEKQSLIRKGRPSSKRSMASLYEYCSLVSEKLCPLVKVHITDFEGHSGVYSSQLYQKLSRKTVEENPLGHLTLSGRSLTDYEVTKYVYKTFPRVRSVHAQDILSFVGNLEPISAVAKRIGMVGELGLSTDVDLWRELNLLTLSREHYRKQIRAESDKIEFGNMSENLAKNRKLLKYINTQLKRRNPASIEDLRPTMEWLRNHTFSWVSYFSQTRGESAAKTLIKELIFQHLMRSGEKPTNHPLEEKKTIRQVVLNASGGWPSAVQPTDATFERRKARSGDIPSLMLRAIDPSNALKEAQIILKYAPDTPHSIRDGKIAFKETYVNLLHQEKVEGFREQSADSHEKVVGVEFFSGSHLLGRGEGYNMQQGIQESCAHMIQNYYTKSFLKE